MVGRCEKVAGTMGTLLRGEVYHYHTKLMMKEPHTGGSFVWHQDYGYVCTYVGEVFSVINKLEKN